MHNHMKLSYDKDLRKYRFCRSEVESCVKRISASSVLKTEKNSLSLKILMCTYGSDLYYFSKCA